NAYPNLWRLAAHFIQRRQPVVNVKHGVLEPLGHDRSRSLLKLQNEMHVLGARLGVEVWRKAKEQHIAKEIEDRLFHGRIETLRCRDGAFDNLPVFLSHRLSGRQVRSVNRKTSDG